MIKPIRGVMSYWNEGGLLLSSCMLVGWFGSRGLLGWFPLTLAILLFIGGGVIAWLLANAAPVDEFSDRNPALDRFLWLWACFSVGLAVFMTLGALV